MEQSKEVLFTTGIKYTYEEHKLFNDFFLKRNKMRYVLYIGYAFLGVMIFLSVITAFKEGNILELVISFLPLPILFMAISRISGSWAKKAWQDSGEADAIWYYGFFEDYMEQTTQKGANKVYYNYMYEIVETDTHFYLMTGKNNGFIIRKENCRPELIAFLREKANALKNN